jgi:RimJ/RimL family protein N-acetyltransferase
MKFIQAGRGFYDKFLEFDKYDFQANILQHTKWLFDESRNKDFPIYFLMDEEKIIGKFIFSPGHFLGGIQLAYFMHPKYTGRGLASFAVEQLSLMDFYNSNHLHVELHIDVENKPSQRVAEKSGFQVIDKYEYKKIGYESTGFFEIWAKTNNLSSEFWVQIPRSEWQEATDWVPGTRYNLPDQARKQGRNTFSGNRQQRRSRGNRR